MTREEAIEIANEVELCQSIWIDEPDSEVIDSLVRFAQRVQEKTRPEQKPAYPWFMKWNKCADFWAHYMCINEMAQEERAYEAKRWIERMRQAAELKAEAQRKPLTDEEIGVIATKSQDGISPHDDTLRFARAIEAAHGIKGQQ